MHLLWRDPHFKSEETTHTPVPKVVLMEYLAERVLYALNAHRIFSDIPGSVTVDFQVSIDAIWPSHESANSPRKVAKPPKNRQAAFESDFTRTHSRVSQCKRARGFKSNDAQMEIVYSSMTFRKSSLYISITSDSLLIIIFIYNAFGET